MAGGSLKPSTSKKHPSPPSSSRKSRWESTGVAAATSSTTFSHRPSTSSAPKSSASPSVPKPSPPRNPPESASKPTPDRNPNPNPNPVEQKKPPQSDRSAAVSAQSTNPPFPGRDSGPPVPPFTPPPPSYGFHMLDRRAIVLADGSVRSYLALPPDYQDFAPPIRRPGAMALSFRPGHEMVGHGRLPFPSVGPMSPDLVMIRDYQFASRNGHEYWNSMVVDDRRGVEGSIKRKYGEEDGRGRDEFVRHRQQLLQYADAGLGERSGFFPGGRGSPTRRQEEMVRPPMYPRTSGEGFDDKASIKREVDPVALKKAFLNYAKVINDNASQRKNYLENGKYGPLQCVVCGRAWILGAQLMLFDPRKMIYKELKLFVFLGHRMAPIRSNWSSKDFADVHDLIMHAYNSHNADQVVDHLGLHKALCVLMGWDYFRPPDYSRAYQFLHEEQAAAFQDDLIMWPPTVIIRNTSTGKGKDGHMEGLGNKAVDSKIRELGFSGGKSRSLYSRDGHLGVSLVKFSADQNGLREAMQLADHFEKENHGRRDWGKVQSALSGNDGENNPSLVKVDRTGSEQRILYGYLGTASDLEIVDNETKKKVGLESKQEYLQSK